jgi:uncharacterized membrane protein YhaH (DUF805 family)
LARNHDGGVHASAEGKTGLNAGITSNCLAFTGGYARKAAVNRTVHCLTQQITQQKDSVMNDNASAAAGAAMGLGLVLFILAISLAFYVFYCFCAKRICEKCGVNPGILIWIPIVNLIPLLQVAKMPVWMILLFLVPLVNIVIGIMMWVKICQARGKSGWLVIMMVIPIANLIFLPYLAFSE